MPFQQSQLAQTVNQSQDIFDEYIYRSTNGDTLEDITAVGYFAASRFAPDWFGSLLTFYVDGVLYSSRVESDKISILGGGGNSFAIGPTPNEFRSTALAGAIALLEAQTIADPEWLAVYDAAPLAENSNSPLNVRIFYTVDNINYMDLMARDTGLWVVNQSFQGIQGEKGVDGQDGSGYKSSFASPEDRDDFFFDAENHQYLIFDTPISVTFDNTVFQYRWKGESNPTTYVPDFWVISEIGTTSGTMILGPTTLEVSGEQMIFTSASDVKNMLIQCAYDDTGSSRAYQPELSGLGDFPISPISDSALPMPFSASAIVEDSYLVTGLIYMPSQSGLVGLKVYSGTAEDHSVLPIIDITVAPVPTEILKPTLVKLKNPITMFRTQSIYFEIEGTDIQGGNQVEGAFSGMLAPFLVFQGHIMKRKGLALEETSGMIKFYEGDIPAYGNLKQLFSTDFTVNNTVDAEVGVIAHIGVNPNKWNRVLADSTDENSGTLLDKIEAGDNIDLNVRNKGTDQDKDMVLVISAEGSGDVGPVSLIEGKAVGFNDSLGDGYGLVQYAVDLENTTSGTPFFFKGDTTPPILSTITTDKLDDIDCYGFSFVAPETATYDAVLFWCTEQQGGGTNYVIRIKDDDNKLVFSCENLHGYDPLKPQILTSSYAMSLVAANFYHFEIQFNGGLSHAPCKGDASNDHAYFMGVKSQPNSFSKVDLLTADTAYPAVVSRVASSLVSQTNITAHEYVQNYTVVRAGTYQATLSAILIGSVANTRWGQFYLEHNGSLIAIAQSSMIVGAVTGDFAANVSYDLHGIVCQAGDQLDLKVQASEYGNLRYKALNSTIFQLSKDSV